MSRFAQLRFALMYVEVFGDQQSAEKSGAADLVAAAKLALRRGGDWMGALAEALRNAGEEVTQ